MLQQDNSSSIPDVAFKLTEFDKNKKKYECV